MSNATEFTMRPIGVIHSPFNNPSDTPIQSSRSRAAGEIEVYPEFQEGLQDIEGLSHLILLYVFHLSTGYALRVRPFLDLEMRGLFATRYPARPNPIGISVVRVLALRGNVLEIEGVDVLDGTPLLDIKPYLPDFDVRTDVRTGWYATRSADRDKG